MSDNPANEPEIVEVAERATAVIAGVVEMSSMTEFFDRAFSTLPAVLAAQQVEIAGPAFALHRRRPTHDADLEVGFPTTTLVEADGEVRVSLLPGGQVARLVHEGSFDGLAASWERLAEWISAEGLSPGGSFWEVYLTEPTPETDPATLRTELNWPVSRPSQ